MQNAIRNMLSIPRVGTYVYYRPDEESNTRFIEVVDFIEGRVYFNGDEGEGDCTLKSWQNWVRHEMAVIEEYAI